MQRGMDKKHGSCLLESLLQQPADDSVFRGFPLRPVLLAPHLRKILLLRRLSSDLSAGDLSGDTLQSLELIEEIDRSLGATTTSEALKAAYSAVAAELTAAPLSLGNQADFFEAVNGIWNCRVGDLERSEARCLVGDGLRQWRRLLEEAVVSDAAREEVLQRDTRRDAVETLRWYLSSASTETRNSYSGRISKSEEEKRTPGVAGVSTESSGANKSSSIQLDVPADGTGAEECSLVPAIESQKSAIPSGQMDIQARGLRKLNRFNMSEVDEVKKALKSSVAELRKVVEDPLPNALSKSSEIQGMMEKLEGVDGVKNALKSSVIELRKVVEDPLPNALSKASKIQGMMEKLEGVDGVKNALKSSVIELRKVVEDPLSNALSKASEIQSMMEKLEGVNAANKEPNEVYPCTPGPSVDGQCSISELTAAEDCRGILCVVKPRYSLMDRNPTAHTSEWNEYSVEVSPDTSPNSTKRSYLPIPRDRRVSSLQMLGIKQFARRRKVRRWSPQEEDALREAVKEHGKGKWKLILQSYPGIFEYRSEVDLKDKWRNMTR